MPPCLAALAYLVLVLALRHASNCTPASQWVVLAQGQVQLLTGLVRTASIVVRLSSPSVRVDRAGDPIRWARVRIAPAIDRFV
jgi:hypothetical protein